MVILEDGVSGSCQQREQFLNNKKGWFQVYTHRTEVQAGKCG